MIDGRESPTYTEQHHCRFDGSSITGLGRYDGSQTLPAPHRPLAIYGTPRLYVLLIHTNILLFLGF